MTLAQMFFEINKNICDMYNGLNPLNILEYPAEDVFNLLKDTIDYNKRQVETGKAPDRDGMIRKPAGDDWF